MAALSNAKILKIIEANGITRAADILGLSPRTLGRYKKKIEQGEQLNITLTDDNMRVGGRNGLPLSENERKFHPEWTADDCIEELLRVAKLDPSKFITRNHFRNYSNI